ncbi:hypothetical protein BOTBODRAFT_155292 [Botryobasidium botryosum FD-172 SS1]|uniref:Telomere length regulation protein conserved domain-containing protein n=1 Tax=Botryobasidium botryosum (strain FD-172 SS1) TaxID=930990 RepID=A0A067MR14_BOTB1|nr:hypothetical protein BOTBODRAFT_155292 [Botryobasidium botryosum FD-172 SS1]
MSDATKNSDRAGQSAEILHELIKALSTPISDRDKIASLLSAPLSRLSLLPPELRSCNTSPIPEIDNAARWIPSLQHALLRHVIPVWEIPFAQVGFSSLLEQYFCPVPTDLAQSGEIALHAYSALLTPPLSSFSLRILARLAGLYSVDRLYKTIFGAQSLFLRSDGQKVAEWGECVRITASVPGKVANELADDYRRLPRELENDTYFEYLGKKFESLVYDISNSSTCDVSSVSHLLVKLVNIGLFPPTLSSYMPSFFSSNLPTIRARLSSSTASSAYSAFWSSLLLALSPQALQTLLSSLFSALSYPPSLDPSEKSRKAIKQEAVLLERIVGNIQEEGREHVMEAAYGVVLSRPWGEEVARVSVCWAAGYGREQGLTESALDQLLTRVLDIWTSTQHIKLSLLSRHRYLTFFLLLVLSYLDSTSQFIVDMSHSPAFISCIGIYIGHPEIAIRRCGMMVAEYVAKRAGKELDFGSWDGAGEGREWVRDVRALINARDGDVEITSGDIPAVDVPEVGVESLPSARASENQDAPTGHAASRAATRPPLTTYDSDDSLTGYASPSPTSRPSSPTPSELEEIERDPTLRRGAEKKVHPPVYLADLGQMIQGGSGKKEDAEVEASRIEMALQTAAELVRRKRDYGTELEENAVNLTILFAFLQDNFDLEGFEEKRQATLNALVACCPKKAAPCLAEQFFNNQYSTAQRFAMLTALALGARELADLSSPPQATSATFPSKALPPALHRKYIMDADISPETNRVSELMRGITHMAIDRGRREAEEKIPEIVREKQLRVRPRRPDIAEVGALGAREQLGSTNPRAKVARFKELAVEYFILPLINRFWLYLRDEQAREQRSLRSSSAYRGAGTGMVLEAMLLSHFLSTLTILMHAAHHSPAYLSILAPEALEVALTMGTRPVSVAADSDPSGKDKEAAVLGSAFELALVVLDTCAALDGGKSLGLEHTKMLLAIGEWAGEMFALLEKGVNLEGGGGDEIKRVRRAAASVVIKVEEMTSRWRRSMINL